MIFSIDLTRRSDIVTPLPPREVNKVAGKHVPRSLPDRTLTGIGVMSDLCHVGPTKSASLMCHVGPTMSDLSTMLDLYASTKSDLSSLKYILKQIATLFKYIKKITTPKNTRLFIHSNIDNIYILVKVHISLAHE